MNRVVVFFPSWRYFGHFALPLFEPLAEHYEIIFFHTEKAIYGWEDCPDLSDKGIETVDLHSLQTFSFVKALKSLRADLIVVFDKGWVQDRALLYAAKHLGIPSLHIQHGIIATLEDIETKNRFQRACNEFMKIIRTFRLYDSTLIHIGSRAWFKSLPFQMRLLLNPNDYYYNHRHETVADLACIIGERDRLFFVEKEGYREEQLVPMGALQFEKAYAMEPQDPEPKLLLISQPLFEDHVLEGGLAAKKEHIREIIEASPLPVAIKPHPREDRQWYMDNFQSSELLVYPADRSINEAILDCSHVVGYFSTALINALILQRPVGIVHWVDDHAYVLNLDADGAAVRLDNPDDLSRLTSTGASAVEAALYAFDTNVGSVLQSTLDRLLNC
ncbi:polysialyltransferase family glycosyltransferase [Pontiellaceae bacterium B12219]|nr:polysialyltransferase family glycosyltransferase [Pontiellaceae bacterium B12219]